MHHRNRILATLAGSIILATAGVGAQALAADPHVTLRIALVENETEPVVGAFVTDLIEQVGLASDTITIEPVWQASAGASSAPYQVVAKRVVDGDFEMGLVPARAWDEAGVTSLQALQAPFLITDDHLATAVAEDDIAQRMLDGMASAGVVGLALYPQDLRHLFSFDECHATPFVSPDDLSGAAIGEYASQLTVDLLRTLSAQPIDVGDGSNVDCRLEGAESGLGHRQWNPLRLTATANVTFFPRYDVLVIDDAAFDRLTESQQMALRQAVATARQHVIEARETDAVAGAAWCADGGRIVLASDEQLAAFQTATQPLYAQLEQDSLTKELIAAIRDLKASTEPSPGAQACERPTSTETQPPASGGAAAQLPPNGVYRATITAEELEALGVGHQDAVNNDGIMTWTFEDGTSSMLLDDGFPPCGLTIAVSGSVVRLQLDGTGGCDPREGLDFRWTLSNGDLVVTFVAARPAGEVYSTYYKAYFERSWKRVE